MGLRHKRPKFPADYLAPRHRTRRTKVIDDQIGSPTSAVDLAEATTAILAGMIARAKDQPTLLAWTALTT